MWRQLIYCQLKVEKDSEKKIQNLQFLSLTPSPFFPCSTSLRTFLPPPSEQYREMGNGDSAQFITLHLCSSFLLMLFPCSSTGSLPWQAVLHELLTSGSFPQAAVLQELLKCSCFPWGTVIQDKHAPAQDPHGLQFPTESQLWHGISKDCSFLQDISTWHDVGSSIGCSVDICSTVDLHVLQGHSLHHHCLLHGLQGNLCSGTWSTSSLSFTDLGVCRVVSHILTPLSGWIFCVEQ